MDVKNADSFADIRDVVRQVGAAVGAGARAEALIAQMDATLADLDAHPRIPGVLVPRVDFPGEWGEVYAGLVTGTLPREFPLPTSQKFAENLFLLVNPSLARPP